MTPRSAPPRSCALATITLAAAGSIAQPELERVANDELAGPLAQSLAVPPVDLSVPQDFLGLFRDPRMPGVLIRRSGEIYAAFPADAPVALPHEFGIPIPRGTIFFAGRPSVNDLARVTGSLPTSPPPFGTRSVANVPLAERASDATMVSAPAPARASLPLMLDEGARALRLRRIAGRYAADD
jgi:hypothetical protein